MLRMGRSPKVESNEPRAAEAPSAPTQPLQPPPAQTYQPQPVAHAYEPPARAAQPSAAATPSMPRAVTESEALATGLSLEEIRTRSFVKIIESLREARRHAAPGAP